MKLYITVATVLLFFNSFSQVNVNNNQTVEWYIQNVLAGSGVNITNVQFNGGSANVQNEQVGEFTDNTSTIGLPNGLILGSGDVTLAAQNNSSGSSSLGGSGGAGSDPDLSAIATNGIYDECVVEFDFVPIGDSISFSYVFASEEYSEWVCGNVNDVFGFFLSGPNPGGGNYNADNLALIPDPNNLNVYTNTVVSINTVNSGSAGTFGTPSGCSSIDPNWTSYSVFYAGDNSTSNYEYDGNTVVLTVRAPVICNQTYHIKLAIGDGGDGAYDSGVFFEGGSFTSLGVNVEAGIADGDTILYEGCNRAFFSFTRPDTINDFTVRFVMSGTATNGVDYAEVPDSLTLTAGVFSDSVFIFPIQDNDQEGEETVEMLIIYEICGGQFDTVSSSLILNDYEPIYVELPDSINICSPETVDLNPTIGGGLPDLFYSWSSGQTVPNITVGPSVTQEYTITVSDNCGDPGSATTKIWVQCPIIIPNVFSPNGDGKNEMLIIENLDDYTSSKLTVYNRWGQIVYYSDDYLNDWDGTHYKTGKPLDEGVYYCVVAPNSIKYEYNQSDNKEESLRSNYTGNIQIFR